MVNRALASAGLRSDVGLILETGEARETMHFALLLGFGATAVNPYLALATVTSLAAPQDCPLDVVKASGNYINAIDKGLLKIMSKMGISTLRSYRSSQLFEAVGLNRELIDEFFPGTVSRVGGIGLDEIAVECNQRAAQHAEHGDKLDAGGQYKYKKAGRTISGIRRRFRLSALPYVTMTNGNTGNSRITAIVRRSISAPCAACLNLLRRTLSPWKKWKAWIPSCAVSFPGPCLWGPSVRKPMKPSPLR